MSDLLAQGAGLVNGVRHRSLTRAVSYRRGELAIQALPATVGQTLFRLDDAAGGTIRYASRDYLVRSADLVLDGQRVEPKRGDQLVDTVAGKPRTYEVLGPGNGEPDWRWSDPDGDVIRLHTREVA